MEDVPALGLVKGDSFSLAWLRSARSMEHAWHHCELALGNWYRGQHQVWLREQVRGGEAMRVVRRARVLTREVVGAERQPLTRTLSPKGRGEQKASGETGAEQPGSSPRSHEEDMKGDGAERQPLTRTLCRNDNGVSSDSAPPKGRGESLCEEGTQAKAVLLQGRR